MHPYQTAIQTYTAAVSALDSDAFVGCFAAECELNDPVGSPTGYGHAGVRAFFAAVTPILASARMTAGSIHINAASVAFTWTLEGTGMGGQTATATGIDVWQMDGDAKILRSDAYWDAGAFVGALTA